MAVSFGGKFSETGNSLAHGVQEDGISCIPVTMNTIAHGIFGEPLWTHEHWYLDRMKWFLKLVPKLIQHVQVCTPTGPGICGMRSDPK